MNAPNLQAFPGNSDHQSGQNIWHSGGMDLRDYLAAKAMAAIAQDLMNQGLSLNEIAKAAYQIADAMLAERERSAK